MTLIKINNGLYSLQSFQLTIDNKSRQVVLTILSNIEKEYIRLQAPQTDASKVEFLKHFFSYMSKFAENDSPIIDISEPLQLAEQIGFKKGFTLSVKASVYGNTLKTHATSPTEGIMFRYDSGEKNNEVLTRHYIHLASDAFAISSKLKTTSNGATLFFYLNGNKAYRPYFKVYLSQPLKTNRSINLYAKKLEETLVELAKRQHYIDLLQAVKISPPTFRSLTDYTLGVTKRSQ